MELLPAEEQVLQEKPVVDRDAESAVLLLGLSFQWWNSFPKINLSILNTLFYQYVLLKIPGY